MSLTTDLWTSAANHGYITLTSHYINKNWELKNHVLVTRELNDKHTGVNIANCRAQLKEEFELSDITCIVTDNASALSETMPAI